MITERVWRGVIAVLDTPTLDGRRVKPDALSWDLPIPIHVPNVGVVGAVYAIMISGVFVWAEGTINDIDGCIGCGVDLDEVEVNADDAPDMMVITRGRIMALTVYVNGELPAWPGCAIITVT